MYYNAIAAGYDELHLEEQRRKLKTLLTRLEVRPGDAVLDVGCGSGVAFEHPAFQVSPSFSLSPLSPFFLVPSS